MRARSYPMPWHMAQRTRAASLERLLDDVERRLSRLAATLPSRPSDATMDRASDSIASALSEIAEKFRGRARSVGSDASRVSEEALERGQQAMRRLAREAEQRPLVTLAVALGVGALAIGLFARR
jgi:hypothetical protein